jgi:glutamate formiminotransferase
VLLAVPNFSEGRDEAKVAAISAAFATGAAVLDSHSDPIHNRSVLTMEAPAGSLAGALVAGARACVEAIDMTAHEGAHPCVGALDVCPVVWLREADRDPARHEALEAARMIAGESGVPVFLYGELASDPRRAERSFFRQGGLLELRRRVTSGELAPDFGPAEPHPTAGATLVTARPPLVAFNITLEGADRDIGREVAAGLREAGGGPPGVRAIAIDLGDGTLQISTNVHNPVAVPLAEIVEQVRGLAGRRGARPASAELIGLAPEAALAGYPDDVPLQGFDPARHVIERRIRLD